jgi:hypothetical protein
MDPRIVIHERSIEQKSDAIFTSITPSIPRFLPVFQNAARRQSRESVVKKSRPAIARTSPLGECRGRQSF